ncbi:unnamed protein product [Vicia faba]|uniref:Fe2OG dioxygenase domain-containing protein n=1 Tax=Vicia faba TaxID=3906 RepID=A0AAV0YEH8_VICFA|nr:unnamed protein product [Vicia faba]
MGTTHTSKPNIDSILNERKAFDETKAGVKGLVDAGINNIPSLFHHQPDIYQKPNNTNHAVPVIDLVDVIDNKQDPSVHQGTVDRIKEACETWGFFQVVNHGIPLSVLEELKDGVTSSPALNWIDTFKCYLDPETPKPQDFPIVCRDILLEYGKQMMNLGTLLFELLSKALGLNPNHLKDMNCAEGLVALCHYYPPCPQPELAMGLTKHSDNDFLTVLLQDHIGGLQVLYQDKWIDIKPLPGALIVNVGDLLQLITNDRFKSVEHRVLANRVGPRISVACFFSTGVRSSSKLYGPMKELLSEDNPPKYREITVAEYVAYFEAKGLDGTSALTHYRI